MTELVAFLSGLGGLLLETVFARRWGLALGNGALGATLVLALFLLGLGTGGLAAHRLACRWPLRRAMACLYGGVALVAPLADIALRGWQAPSWAVAGPAAFLVPGALAVAMGAAAPLLLAGPGLSRSRVGTVVGANLLGSVVGAWYGGNLWIPELGIGTTLLLGAGAYGAAALLLLAVGPGAALARGVITPRLPRGAAALAAGSGLLVLGMQVVLLRRLPFWLEGLQPTLAGVLAVSLLGLAGGAAVGTPLLSRAMGGRALGRRAAGAALLLAAAAVTVGLHERLPPLLAAQPVQSTAALHLRIATAVGAASLVPMFLLGAVVPLLLRRLRPARRAAGAGHLLFWQGVGALVGAILAGAVLPRALPQHYFALGPAVLAVLAVTLGRHALGRAVFWCVPLLALAGAVGSVGAGPAWAPRPPIRGARYDRADSFVPQAHWVDPVQTASVVYDRRNHSMLLFTDGFRAAETGPGTAYMRALGHLPLLLRGENRAARIAVIALGTGTTAAAVTEWATPNQVDVVELSPAVLQLAPYFAGDGPVHADALRPRFGDDPRVELHVTDGRGFLQRHAAATFDVITLEPLLPYAPGSAALYSAEFYALAARALRPEGVVVQWIPTHAMPVEFFDALIATFARSFPYASAWLVDQATLLIGSPEPHLDVAAGQVEASWGEHAPALQLALHETGLATAEDLEVALIGDALLDPVAAAPTLVDERPALERVGYWSGLQKLSFLADNLARLREIAEATPDGPWTDRARRQLRVERLAGLEARGRARVAWLGGAAGEAATLLEVAVTRAAMVRQRRAWSVLAHREETLALRAMAELEVQVRGATVAWGRVEPVLRRDLRSPLLTASRALRAIDRSEVDPLRLAAAIDPWWWQGAVPADLLDHAQRRGAVRVPPPPGPLEDLSELPRAAALARLASSGSALSFAVRAVFPTRVSWALIDVLRQRPLRAVERAALRPILDPASWRRAAALVAARAQGGARLAELEPLWRVDLPMPAPLAAILDGPAAARQALSGALVGHRDRVACDVLADLLLDPERRVRQAAAATLFTTFEGGIPYDPAWSESQRVRVAEQVRSLHHRSP